MKGWLRRKPAASPTAVEPPPASPAPKAAPTPPAAAPAPSPPPPLAELSNLVAAATKAGRRPTIAVTVLGLVGDSLESVLTLVERECARLGVKPVLVTDQMDLAPFRRRRLVVDQVVDIERRAAQAPDLAWRLYARAQCGLLAQRWRFEAVVSFGRPPEPGCLAALRQGPSAR